MYTLTQQIVCDAVIGIVGIAFIAIGFADFSGMPNLDKFALVWGGVCLGYIMTCYLNIEEDAE